MVHQNKLLYISNWHVELYYLDGIGYIRVSKIKQNQDSQFDSLKKAGCEKIYHEKISGASMQRPEYIRMISELRKGDIIVVRRNDRLGRTTYELIKLMVEWKEMGVDFRSISEGINTSNKMAVFGICSARYLRKTNEKS
ncbi:recombinase family protein [Dyadobacter bucti]|uniref:recombinase family protein n=1 Tax=Dyadobacter bucti TaxID=2572203 RepID=UPI001108EE84